MTQVLDPIPISIVDFHIFAAFCPRFRYYSPFRDEIMHNLDTSSVLVIFYLSRLENFRSYSV